MPDTSPTTATRKTWLLLVGAAIAILLARIAYLVWLCPYDLAADEAQYWDWSRRLDLSYYSKGPGVAWLIAPAVRLFGDTEWAVRLPAALAAFASMLILGRFALTASKGNSRAGWFALFTFSLLPVFYATSQFMTIDGPFYAFWLGTSFFGWSLATRRRNSPGWFFLLGSLIGIGLLCKYTILLLLPGLIVFFIRDGLLPRGRRAIPLMALFVGLVVFSLPVLIWNAQHGWPTVAHLIGAARLPGGDVAPDPGRHYNPLWTLSYFLYPFALLGPPAAWLTFLALRNARRERTLTPDNWRLASFALHTAAPILGFYLLVTLGTDVKLNWPAAGFTVFLVPLAVHAAARIKTDPLTRKLWVWTVGVGLVCALSISFARMPLAAIDQKTVLKWKIDTTPMLKRISGFTTFAGRVKREADALKKETGQDPFIVASTYGRAALLAFYMNGHPSVASADSYMGGRESSYDYFPDTDLSDPGLLGRPAVLFDNAQWVWEKALYFQVIERTRTPRTRYDGPLYRAYEYRGPCREPHMKSR